MGDVVQRIQKESRAERVEQRQPWNLGSIL